MEVIRTYLNNMFAQWEETPRMRQVKEDLEANMEDKYLELKQAGKTENEAIGIVISEFGNIDELLQELNLPEEKQMKSLPVVTAAQVREYTDFKKWFGKRVALGVALCFMAVISLVLISTLVDEGIIFSNFSAEGKDIIGLVPFFLLIAAAVGIFIYSSSKEEKYKYLKNDFYLEAQAQNFVQTGLQAFTSTFQKAVIIGVTLCVLSPLALICISSISGNENVMGSVGVSVLLLMIAVAVAVFIISGSVKESYQILLQKSESKKEEEEKDKLIGAAAAVWWPLVVCVFLIWGFFFHGWEICWIVFPIAGLLFGAFSSVCSIIRKRH